jgi:hypothetical protein
MSSQGPFLPTTVAQAGSPALLRWDLNVDTVELDDGNFTFTGQSPATFRSSFKLLCTGFGFTLIPGAVIQGFTLTFSCATQSGGLGTAQCRDGVAALLYQGNVVGQINSSGTDWTAGTHTRTIGGSSNLWGWTPTYDKINDSSFGCSLDILVPQDAAASIDWIKLTVTYATNTLKAFTWTGGLGLGNGRWPRKWKKVAFTGGVGLGSTRWARKWKKVAFTRGFGLGNAAWTHARGRRWRMTGGVGLGYAQNRITVRHATRGGLGLGGTFVRKVSQTVPLTGGIGMGNTAQLRRSVAKHLTGGFGIGGSNPLQRHKYRVTSGGFGIGGTFTAHRGKAKLMTGGIGYGYTTKWTSVRSLHKRMTGGYGIGGGFRAFGVLNGGLDDFGANRDKWHRGPFTRWEILTALKKYLESIVTDFPIYIATEEPDMNRVMPSDRFVVLMLGSSKDEQGFLGGGGTYSTLRTETLNVRVYSAMSQDQFPRSTDWTLRQDRGALERARLIRKRLNMLDLMDDSGWLVLSQPMRSTATGEPKAMRDNPQWGYFQESFEAMYWEWLG